MSRSFSKRRSNERTSQDDPGAFGSQDRTLAGLASALLLISMSGCSMTEGGRRLTIEKLPQHDRQMLREIRESTEAGQDQEASPSQPQIRRTSYQEDLAEDNAELLPPSPGDFTSPGLQPPDPIPIEPDSSERLVNDPFPIDLATTLRLAGANSAQVALAAERVEEAQAKASAAATMWIPSLTAGLIYNRHNGRIQATPGNVVEVSRGSLFVGGGAGIGGAPTNAGSSGPARMFVDLSLADVLFAPLAARQQVDVAAAAEAATFNDTMLRAAVAYQEFLAARSRQAVALETVGQARRLQDITGDFAAAGAGSQADAKRAFAYRAQQERLQLQAEEDQRVATVHLAAALYLAPDTKLLPTDDAPLPIELISEGLSLDELLAQAIAARPEVSALQSMVDASWTETRQEHWRPMLPHFYVGFSGGGFGGNGNSDIRNFSDRSDFDLAALWELENLGFGNRARRRESESRHRQAHLAATEVQNQILQEVAQAYHRVQVRRLQLKQVEPQVAAADDALKASLAGIHGGEVRPIEAQQAISALSEAKNNLADSIAAYNIAQFSLLRATGEPPQFSGEVAFGAE